jgi:hypothetical protein
MADSKVLHEDKWGEIIDRPSLDVLELRWFDSTAEMSADAFKQSLSIYADHVERARRRGALVDGTSFLMAPANMDEAWRDANIVPRYNEAGVAKFAFHMPAGMPAIGSEPTPEGPAKFPTGYFGTRQDALDWLAG